MKLPSWLALTLATGTLALYGCAANRPNRAETTAAATAWVDAVDDDYTFVFMLAGPREGKLDTTELTAVRDGHAENMKRLVEQGLLLIAGPLTDPRSDLRHRFIFVFDVDDVDVARETAERDPSVQLGAYEPAVYPFSSPQDLRRVLELERAAAKAKTEDPSAPGPGTRPFVLATADAAAAMPAIEHLEREGLAFFHGVFGGDLAGTALVALDALRQDAAEVMLAETGTTLGIDVAWTLHGWFSTESVAALASAKD